MAWMESIGCASCAANDGSSDAAAVEPYLLYKNTMTKSGKGGSSKRRRRRGLKFVAKRSDVKDEFRAVVTV